MAAPESEATTFWLPPGVLSRINNFYLFAFVSFTNFPWLPLRHVKQIRPKQPICSRGELNHQMMLSRNNTSIPVSFLLRVEAPHLQTPPADAQVPAPFSCKHIVNVFFNRTKYIPRVTPPLWVENILTAPSLLTGSPVGPTVVTRGDWIHHVCTNTAAGAFTGSPTFNAAVYTHAPKLLHVQWSACVHAHATQNWNYAPVPGPRRVWNASRRDRSRWMFGGGLQEREGGDGGKY